MEATDKLNVELLTKYCNAKTREHLKQLVRIQYKIDKNGQQASGICYPGRLQRQTVSGRSKRQIYGHQDNK